MSAVGTGDNGARRPRHTMDVNKMIQELRAEREQLDEVILGLERLARGRGKRRGRPPAWLSQMKNSNLENFTAVKKRAKMNAKKKQKGGQEKEAVAG